MRFSLSLPTVFAVGLALMPMAASSGTTTEAETETEATAAVQGDVEAGQKLYKKTCRGCHGPTAKGLASYPTLRGQTAEYLVDKLERYRAGEKFGPNTALMAPNARKLSDEDIIDISAFIVSLD